MRLMGMRFRDFTWKDNPVDLQVKAARRVAEKKIPYGQTQVEEVGQERRKVSGKGYFAGEDCMERWNDLQQVFSQGGPGLLQLPGLSPFWAVMDALELEGVSGKDLVRYGFSFTEWTAQETYAGTGVHWAQEGESLWDYGARWNRPVEELVACNPHISDIDWLQQGEKVVVP